MKKIFGCITMLTLIFGVAACTEDEIESSINAEESSLIESSNIASSNTPSDISTPSTSTPSTSVPSTSIPSTSVPSTSIPSTSIPSTSIPSSSSSETESSTPTTSIPVVTEKPTLFVVGDSTACSFINDKSDALKYYPRVGFGTQLEKFLSEDITVMNLAISGRSSKSFTAELNYTETLVGEIGEGDYLIIAFAHNDEKAEEARYTNPNEDETVAESFQWYLYEKYCKLALDNGATPILCTPIVRYDKSGSYAEGSNALHHWGGAVGYPGGDYSEAIRTLAEKKNIQLIDNTALTATEWSTQQANATKYHSWGKTTVESIDGTHLNEYGAKMVSYLMMNTLKESSCGLNSYIISDLVKPTEDVDLIPNPNYVEAVYTPPTSWSSIWTTSSPWQASAFGYLGGNPNTTNYTVSETADGINLICKNNKGKIASSSDGILMYFQQIEADKDLTITAKAKINSVDANSQVAFGLMIRDDMHIDANDQTINSDYCAVGGLGFAPSTISSFSREYSALIKGKTSYTSDTTTVYDLRIEKVGDIYKSYFNGTLVSTLTLNLDEIDFDFNYVGLFAARNIDVLFSDINVSIN